MPPRCGSGTSDSGGLIGDTGKVLSVLDGSGSLFFGALAPPVPSKVGGNTPGSGGVGAAAIEPPRRAGSGACESGGLLCHAGGVLVPPVLSVLDGGKTGSAVVPALPRCSVSGKSESGGLIGNVGVPPVVLVGGLSSAEAGVTGDLAGAAPDPAENGTNGTVPGRGGIEGTTPAELLGGASKSDGLIGSGMTAGVLV